MPNVIPAGSRITFTQPTGMTLGTTFGYTTLDQKLITSYFNIRFPQEDVVPVAKPLTADKPIIKPLENVEPWDPFPAHTCETCTERRATYTDEDKAEARRKWVENNQARIDGALADCANTRAKALKDAEVQRLYYSPAEVEKRIVAEERAHAVYRQNLAVANLKNNLTHHEQAEAERIFNLPENVAAREAVRAAERVNLLAFMERYNQPEALAERKARRTAEMEAAWQAAKQAYIVSCDKHEAMRNQRTKGRQLLRDVIGEERWAYYDQFGHFFFMSQHGQKYRIDHGYSNNIFWYESPDSIIHLGSICGYPSPRCPETGDLLPHEDLMAGQFLATVQNERNYLQISVCHGEPSWYRQVLNGTFRIPKGGFDYDIAPDGSVVKKEPLVIDLTDPALVEEMVKPKRARKKTEPILVA